MNRRYDVVPSIVPSHEREDWFKTMPPTLSPQALVLPLDEINHLFVAPPYDPLAGQYEELSGLDRIFAEFQAPTPDPGELVLKIPAEQITPGLEATCRTAIAGVCAARIEDLTQQRRATKLLGRRELIFGLGFLAICLLIAIILETTVSNTEFFGHFLIEGVIIVGWIALWNPVDMLIYAPWPIDRDIRVYERIRALEVRIVANESQ